MEDYSGESCHYIYDHFSKANYEAVEEAVTRLSDQVEKSGNEEENEAFQRQKLMVTALLEYFKDGCKDPKKAYKTLSLIENEQREESGSETNYLLEYNCGVFAYLSQMNGNALKHFIQILDHPDEAELFLILKSAFNCLQILVDNQYIEAAKMMVNKIEGLLPDLIRVRDIKMCYKSTTENDGTKMGGFADSTDELKIEEFSISTGAYLPHPTNSPKSP